MGSGSDAFPLLPDYSALAALNDNTSANAGTTLPAASVPASSSTTTTPSNVPPATFVDIPVPPAEKPKLSLDACHLVVEASAAMRQARLLDPSNPVVALCAWLSSRSLPPTVDELKPQIPLAKSMLAIWQTFNLMEAASADIARREFDYAVLLMMYTLRVNRCVFDYNTCDYH